MNTEHAVLTSTITTLRMLRTAAVESNSPSEEATALELAALVGLNTAAWNLERTEDEGKEVVKNQRAIQKDYSQYTPTTRFGYQADRAAESLVRFRRDKSANYYRDFIRNLHKDAYLSWPTISSSLHAPETVFVGILSTGYLELMMFACLFHDMDSNNNFATAPIALSKDLQLAAVPDLSSYTKYIILYDDVVDKGLTQLYAYNHVAVRYRDLHIRKTQRITVDW